jgi:predicted nuclease of predicted toxin-antitoxin system
VSRFRYPVVADENIHPRVVAYLRDLGFNVLDVKEQGWYGMDDEEILARAHGEGRVVISHDRDFGTLVVAAGKPLTGILYLRPADIHPENTISKLARFLESDLPLEPPFIAVLRGTKVRIRNLDDR